MINNPFHPGVFLDELLNDLEISAYKLAKDTFMPQTRISDILKQKRGITPDTAKRLAKYFGTSEEYWMNLQTSYDLSKCKPEHIDDIIPISA